ncbi:hypothetical protein GGS23DRAFT_309421 [Durotheca rogersii]|uniref:uncharacterized protein n=1 Tax=Durotheca rogersii TaxID=419775 RepID=UPI00221EB0E4|nr:uncharacterized protein GGS23DRAFT_309421 [Durotheca rogersii]KAI5859664.1 hypothetical protein GGS23DRAFT_309421 [Durotheca rogersii]
MASNPSPISLTLASSSLSLSLSPSPFLPSLLDLPGPNVLYHREGRGLGGAWRRPPRRRLVQARGDSHAWHPWVMVASWRPAYPAPTQHQPSSTSSTLSTVFPANPFLRIYGSSWPGWPARRLSAPTTQPTNQTASLPTPTPSRARASCRLYQYRCAWYVAYLCIGKSANVYGPAGACVRVEALAGQKLDRTANPSSNPVATAVVIVVAEESNHRRYFPTLFPSTLHPMIPKKCGACESDCPRPLMLRYHLGDVCSPESYYLRSQS